MPKGFEQKAPTPLVTAVVPVYLWTVLANGSYNRVWKSNYSTPTTLVAEDPYAGPWVLKYPISSNDQITNAMNDKNRAVRVWNEVNSLLPKAGLYKQGWVAPFIENSRPSTDVEAATKTVEIYRDRRRIILDAATKGNFLTKMVTGEVVLVDVDLALKRFDSLASKNYAENLESRTVPYWINKEVREMPLTVEVTRNLLYLEDKLSFDEIDRLCEENHMSRNKIQALTWLRLNNIPLTINLFYQIAVLVDSKVTVDEVLINALCSAHKAAGQFPSNTAVTGLTSQSIFSKNPTKQDAAPKNEDEKTTLNFPKQ